MLVLLFSVSLVSAQSEGIRLQKDVILGVPILGPEDLPEEITFTLYDAQNGLTPLGSQTFSRGQYTVDFEFSKSDGVTSGNVARIKADFTDTLNLQDDFGEPVKPTELWAALEVAGSEVGPRTKVSDETLVRLLLNSDASLATYLTLAYEGDENPITTIYKDLPMSFVSSDGYNISLNDYFSGLVGGIARDSGESSTTEPYWERVGGALYYNDGKVGIGTTNPTQKIETTGTVYSNPGGGSNAQFKLSGGGVSGDWFFRAYGSAGSHPSDFTIARNTSNYFHITSDGNIGIGTQAPGTFKLAVAGKIRAEEIRVDTGWADFVFEAGYKLPSLNEVEMHIQQKGHLPGIPTEAEVKKQGISIGEISSKLLQKIEELTLYVIDIKKENESLKDKVGSLEAQLKASKISHQ
jgi:hypothetical protein